MYTIGPDRQPGQHEKEHTSDRLDIRPTNYIRPTGYTRPTGHIRPTEMCPVMFVQRCPKMSRDPQHQLSNPNQSDPSQTDLKYILSCET